jgi:hypothetical protein
MLIGCGWRRVRRWAFNLATAASLVVCLVFVGFWVRSKATDDIWELLLRWRDGDVGNIRHYQCVSGEGQIHFTYQSNILSRVRDPLEWGPDGKVVAWRMWITPPRSTRQGVRFVTFHGFVARRLSAPANARTSVRFKGYHVAIPHWFAVLVSGVLPTVWLIAHLRRARRAAAGHCPTCGYDLRASPDRCPECGTPAELKVAT